MSATKILTIHSPGRVNLLGEHVDYNDGMVLPAAIDRRVTLRARAIGRRIVRLRAEDLNAETAFDLDHLDDKVDVNGLPLPAWARYPAGVAWAARRDGLEVRAVEATFTSQIPMGAGVSSSAAVEVAFALLWDKLACWGLARMALAQLCLRAEQDYVGVRCGIMDQFACACGVAEHALYLDTRSLEWQPLPLPSGATIIIADSGVRRALADSAYNQRRQACEQAVHLLRASLPGLRALRDVSPAQLDQLHSLLPPIVARRARHVVTECERVRQALNCLQRGDAAGFGALMFAGHASLRDLYEVSTPELDTLVAIAGALPGCWGARLSGAGFGGCTVNLVAEAAPAEFMERLCAGYARQTGREATVYLCHASAGAQVVD
ncbi:MAG: galactokinase [Anaerolineae bacterium]|nr:galactokinase [Anaerolineae bacterium]